MSDRNPKMRYVCVGFVALCAMGLASCGSEYLTNKDTIALGAGNASHANRAIHTPDPWPPHARRRNQTTDGTKAANAIDRYRRPVPTP